MHEIGHNFGSVRRQPGMAGRTSTFAPTETAGQALSPPHPHPLAIHSGLQLHTHDYCAYSADYPYTVDDCAASDSYWGCTTQQSFNVLPQCTAQPQAFHGRESGGAGTLMSYW